MDAKKANAERKPKAMPDSSPAAPSNWPLVQEALQQSSAPVPVGVTICTWAAGRVQPPGELSFTYEPPALPQGLLGPALGASGAPGPLGAAPSPLAAPPDAAAPTEADLLALAVPVPLVCHASNAVRCLGEPLDAEWWRGRQWSVTRFGLEARDGLYAIPVDALAHGAGADRSWAEHMAEKGWVDQGDFVTAWIVALALHGLLPDTTADLPKRRAHDATGWQKWVRMVMSK